MKRRVLGMILVAAMLTGLVGCGETSSTTPSSDSSDTSAEEETVVENEEAAAETEEAAQEPVTITFGFWGDDAEASMKMALAEAYMELHPNVTIEMEYSNGTDYLTKFQTWLSSNDSPDVFGIANDHLVIAQESEMFEDLGSYVQADGLEELWDYEACKKEYTIANGRMVAVPFVNKTFAIAYNKDLFDQANIDYPTADWTEEDMLAAAEAISALGDDIYGLRWGVRVPEFYRGLYGELYYDPDSYSMNIAGNEGFKAAVTMFSDTIINGLAPDETSGVISTGGFETGKFGMALSATWDIAVYDAIGDSFAWDIVELPNSTEFGTRWSTTLRANGWSMNANAENKDVCWDFIKFLSTSEESAIGASTIGIPALTSYLESDAYMNTYTGTAYNKSVFINMIEGSVGLYNLGAFAEVNDLAKADYEMVLAGSMTVDDMVNDVDTRGADIFASYGY